jgi:hypothetical protein
MLTVSTHPTRDDVREVVASLRGIDVLEATILHFANTPELIEARIPRNCFVVADAGKPVALFGVVGEGDIGYPWLIGTDAFDIGRGQYLRRARTLAIALSFPYRTLTNTMLACNTTHRRFVNWLFRPTWDESLHVSGLKIARFTACVSPQQP